jgi:hypothetical protein
MESDIDLIISWPKLKTTPSCRGWLSFSCCRFALASLDNQGFEQVTSEAKKGLSKYSDNDNVVHG